MPVPEQQECLRLPEQGLQVCFCHCPGHSGKLIDDLDVGVLHATVTAGSITHAPVAAVLGRRDILHGSSARCSHAQAQAAWAAAPALTVLLKRLVWSTPDEGTGSRPHKQHATSRFTTARGFATLNAAPMCLIPMFQAFHHQ